MRDYSGRGRWTAETVGAVFAPRPEAVGMGTNNTDETSERDDEFGYEERGERGPTTGEPRVGDTGGIDDPGPRAGPQPKGDPIAPGREPGPEAERGERAGTGGPRTGRVASGIAALLGTWVVLSTLVYGMGEAAFWNNALVGAAILLGAGYNYYREVTNSPPSLGVAGLVALLGIWLIVAAAVLELAGGAVRSTAVSGLLVVCLAGYTLYEARGARSGVGGQAGTR